MATSLGSLVYTLGADIARFEKAMTRAEQIARRRSKNIRKTFTALATTLTTAFAGC